MYYLSLSKVPLSILLKLREKISSSIKGEITPTIKQTEYEYQYNE